MGDRIAIVVPVLDDWVSFTALARRIADEFSCSGATVSLVAIDDGSAEPFDVTSIELPADTGVSEISVLRLAVNLGHQRAIAVGLSSLARRDDVDMVIVMDGDGEDRPEDIAALRAAHRQNPGHAVLARRSKRSERGVFRVGYVLYKWLFRVLTGQTINFGNFSLLPMRIVRRLVYMPELWNNLPAALIRSRVRYTSVPLARGVRYAGQSKMNLASLIVHGLSAMSVYTDVIFVRIMLLAGLVSGLAMLGMIALVTVRMFTDLGVPGWASTMFGDLMIILMQTLVMVIATSLVLLAGRSQRPIIPIIDAAAFILEDSGKGAVRGDEGLGASGRGV